MTTADLPEPDSDVVDLMVPADVSYVSTLRLAAAGLGSRCELTVDDIEDLRLAVDEACALLLSHARAGSRIETRYLLAPGRLVVSTTVETAGPGELSRDGIAWMVLDALSTAVDVHSGGDRLTIAVCKAREAVQT